MRVGVRVGMKRVLVRVIFPPQPLLRLTEAQQLCKGKEMKEKLAIVVLDV